MRLIIMSLAATAALAACSEQPPSSTQDEAPAPAPADSRASPPTANEPGAPAPSDACSAAEHQDWIGRARSDLPSAPPGANWRVYETGQPVTQDLRPDRLNIEIDPDSQTVVRLSCG